MQGVLCTSYYASFTSCQVSEVKKYKYQYIFTKKWNIHVYYFTLRGWTDRGKADKPVVPVVPLVQDHPE